MGAESSQERPIETHRHRQDEPIDQFENQKQNRLKAAEARLRIVICGSKYSGKTNLWKRLQGFRFTSSDVRILFFIYLNGHSLAATIYCKVASIQWGGDDPAYEECTIQIIDVPDAIDPLRVTAAEVHLLIVMINPFSLESFEFARRVSNRSTETDTNILYLLNFRDALKVFESDPCPRPEAVAWATKLMHDDRNQSEVASVVPVVTFEMVMSLVADTQALRRPATGSTLTSTLCPDDPEHDPNAPSLREEDVVRVTAHALETSMVNCYGLSDLYKFIRVPYLQARHRLLLRLLREGQTQLLYCRDHISSSSAAGMDGRYAEFALSHDFRDRQKVDRSIGLKKNPVASSMPSQPQQQPRGISTQSRASLMNINHQQQSLQQPQQPQQPQQQQQQQPRQQQQQQRQQLGRETLLDDDEMRDTDCVGDPKGSAKRRIAATTASHPHESKYGYSPSSDNHSSSSGDDSDAAERKENAVDEPVGSRNAAASYSQQIFQQSVVVKTPARALVRVRRPVKSLMTVNDPQITARDGRAHGAADVHALNISSTTNTDSGAGTSFANHKVVAAASSDGPHPVHVSTNPEEKAESTELQSKCAAEADEVKDPVAKHTQNDTNPVISRAISLRGEPAEISLGEVVIESQDKRDGKLSLSTAYSRLTVGEGETASETALHGISVLHSAVRSSEAASHEQIQIQRAETARAVQAAIKYDESPNIAPQDEATVATAEEYVPRRRRKVGIASSGPALGVGAAAVSHLTPSVGEVFSRHPKTTAPAADSESDSDRGAGNTGRWLGILGRGRIEEDKVVGAATGNDAREAGGRAIDDSFFDEDSIDDDGSDAGPHARKDAVVGTPAIRTANKSSGASSYSRQINSDEEENGPPRLAPRRLQQPANKPQMPPDPHRPSWTGARRGMGPAAPSKPLSDAAKKALDAAVRFADDENAGT